MLSVMFAQLEITALRHQMDGHNAEVTRLQDAFNAIEDDVFREFCQQINVSNIRCAIIDVQIFF